MGLHLFHGGEQFLVERAFNQAWARFTSGLQSELDAEILDSESTPAEVAVAVGSVGFFSTGRVVGIKDWRALMPKPGRKGRSAKAVAEDPAAQAAEVLDQLPAETELLMSVGIALPPGNPVVKLVKAKGEVFEYQRLRRGDLFGWTAQRCREVGLKLDNAGQRLLVDAVGDDLRLLDSEIEKLDIYAGGRALHAADVALLVPDTAEHQVWDLTDSLMSDPGRAAVELDRALAMGEPAGRLSYMLVRHLRLLLAASAAPSGPTGPAALVEAFAGDGRPLAEYTIKKAIEQASRADPGRLELIYRRAASAEAASRRGELDEDAALRLVVMEAAL
ncbi:MAG TPA: DNA polymerase III subunit delta [Candidatus Solibacter sp.]|nr:DNA polymerase III subunit delta [Candidatus Solibacter sp.]